MKPLFQTNINALLKVRGNTSMSMKMNYTQVILSAENRGKLALAVQKIDEAMKILSEIK
jgi:hypothetical protein